MSLARLIVSFPLLLLATLSMLLSGCAGYRVKDLAKTDIDYVADTHQRMLDGWLRELTTKLYQSNPQELGKARGASIDSRLQQLYSQRQPLVFKELGQRQGVEAMQLAFDERYRGDRVFALSAGLTDMLRKSYGYLDESFLTDDLDADALYRSARNVEALAWRLNHRLDTRGQPLIMAREAPGELSHLSYERLFGKIVAAQDCLAAVAAQGSNRRISKAAQGVASFVFLPI